MRERNAVQLGMPAGPRDEFLGDLVADAPRAGLEHDPHVVTLIEADLDEVVPGTVRAELEDRVVAALSCRRSSSSASCKASRSGAMGA